MQMFTTSSQKFRLYRTRLIFREHQKRYAQCNAIIAPDVKLVGRFAYAIYMRFYEVVIKSQ
jgi:hypothetical protein